MSAKHARLRRYGSFILVGIAVEAVSLLAFRVFRVFLRAEVAYVLSFPANILAGFVLFGGITFRDRPGSWWGKLVRFTGGKLFILMVKALLFVYWLTWVPCPFYDVTHKAVDILALYPLHVLFTCEWMSVALMDLGFAVTIGYLISNYFVFWMRQWFQQGPLSLL